MNSGQAFKALMEGKDVVMILSYRERTERHLFESVNFMDTVTPAKELFNRLVKEKVEYFYDNGGNGWYYCGNKAEYKRTFVLHSETTKEGTKA